jgi:hypothetical protein
MAFSIGLDFAWGFTLVINGRHGSDNTLGHGKIYHVKVLNILSQ